MQTNILWTGREYYSLENCLINITTMGAEINSVIVGEYRKKIYRVEYTIRTSQNWETQFFEIHGQHNNHRDHFIFESDGNGNWKTLGKASQQFQGCIDIDIPVTPFTNTLPVNRLKLEPGEERQIEVIYIDILERQITRVKQKYKRIATTAYHYENVPNDFEAKIEVDEMGFVVDYPALFVQHARLNTQYP